VLALWYLGDSCDSEIAVDRQLGLDCIRSKCKRAGVDEMVD
jgi:hypothetical protein